MNNYILNGLIAFCISVVFALIFIPVLKKVKAGQTILFYVKEHEFKNGTPTMGGLFFMISILLTYLIFSKKGGIATVCVAIAFAYLAIGFLDDLIKIKSSANEGLKPYQKIVFQLAVAIISGFFALKNNLTLIYLPFVNKTFDVGIFIMPITIFVLVAITNSVNLTDGLDGLAGSVSVVYLIGLLFVLIVKYDAFGGEYYLIEELPAVKNLIVISIGAIIGFLCFNTNKASIFMGDTGSLSLGALLGTLTIFTGNVLFMPLLGLMFVLSSLSVIIQVLHFKRTGKRIFLMAPLHHHLQHKGLSEAKISLIYSVITAIIVVFIVIF